MDTKTRTLVVQATLVVLLLVGLAILTVQLANVFLLVFGAVIVAVLIRALAEPLQRRLGLPNIVGVLASVLIIAAVLGAIGWLFGTQIGQQLREVAGGLPEGIEALQAQLATLPFGAEMQPMQVDGQDVVRRILSATSTAIGALTNLIIVLIGAIYLAIAPFDYTRGVARLFPVDRRQQVEDALNATGVALRKFLTTQLITMVVVGVLVSVGLWIAGVPAPIALGLITGVLNFIPNFGPLIAAIPGVLLGLSAGTDTGVAALVVYLIAQQIEGNVLTPILQQRAVNLPPVLLIFALLAFGVLFGPLGLILGAPLTVAVYTLVTMLYSRDTLGDDVAVPGEEQPSAKG